MKTIQHIQHQQYKTLQQNFLQRKKDEGKSASHLASMSTLTSAFLSYLEQQEILQIEVVNQATINQYFTYLSKRKNQRRAGGLSASYLDKHREAVLRLLEYVRGTDIGKSGLVIPIHHKHRIPKDILSQEEVLSLFSHQDNSMNGIRNKAILSLLYGCGIRKSELYHLNAEAIDLHREVVRVKHTKNAYERDVPMSPSVVKHIESYLFGVRQYLMPAYKEEPAFLLSNRGNRMSKVGIAHKVKEIHAKTTITKPVTAHRLRHAIATHLVDTLSIEEIAQFLGHKSIDSSQIYMNLKHTIS